MELKFSSIEEVQEFVKRLKGTRGVKGDKEDEQPSTGQQAPPPMQPPAGGLTQTFPATQTFAPPGQGAGPVQGFPAAGATPTLSPEAQYVTGKIIPRLQELLNGGQDPNAMLNWFRAECSKVDPSAAGANLDQIKSTFLPKLSMQVLEHIAGLIGVPK